MKRIYRQILPKWFLSMLERVYYMIMKMTKTIVLAGAVSFTAACTSVGDVIQTNDQCGQIGCADGLQFYPHEQFSADRQPRRWYGINGELPSDYPAGSPQRQKLRQQQIEKLRSMGLDPQGRPLSR